jgi:molybdenum cofactor sulfurtransferase
MIEDLFQEKLGRSRDSEIQTESLTYLDYAGCPLPSKTYLKDVFEELTLHGFGNPHSVGGVISKRTEKMIEETRALILKHISASPTEYEVIFTSGATSSVKSLVEMFPWQDKYNLLYPQNVHTSLLSLRSYVDEFTCLNVNELYDIEGYSDALVPPSASSLHNHLLVAPGECNMSGIKLSYERLFALVDNYRKTGSEFYWLLDAAKYCSTSELNIEEIPENYRPDFIILSFYKLFGYPTGIGALIVKKSILPFMKKK